jgi:acyl dehydratase
VIGRPIQELALGTRAEFSRVVSDAVVRQFVQVVGDDNPLHADPEFAAATPFGRPIVPGVLTAGLVSAVIGTTLPGPGSLYISQDLRFVKPVFPGDTITAIVEVVEIVEARNRIRLSTVCVNQHGEEVLIGEAWVKPPRERIEYQERRATAGEERGTLPWAWGAVAMGAYARATVSTLEAWRQLITT